MIAIVSLFVRVPVRLLQVAGGSSKQAICRLLAHGGGWRQPRLRRSNGRLDRNGRRRGGRGNPLPASAPQQRGYLMLGTGYYKQQAWLSYPHSCDRGQRSGRLWEPNAKLD